MPILSADHLLEQADRLILPPPAGPPRQVDVRRAISAAYYAVFHAVLTAAADTFVGATKRTTSEYALVYRSTDHKTVRELCLEIRKRTMPTKYRPHIPPGGFSEEIKVFCGALVELQEKRVAADYDPTIRVKTSDALLAISTARTALDRFGNASETQRKAFLGLLLFQPR